MEKNTKRINKKRPEGDTPEGPTKENKKIKIHKKIISWIKGKKKLKEVQKLKPDKDFSFEENYYGKIDMVEGFKIIYCNNYNKIFHSNKNVLSFISCVVSLPKNDKTIKDLINFINIYIRIFKYSIISLNSYDNINININEEKINIFFRGNINFYSLLCDNIYNNIITKYIRNYIFPNELPIDCPNEFTNNIYNSITNPCKDIDILFIEDNPICKEFSPIIGLSISKNHNKICFEKDNRQYICYNNRFIFYLSINTLDGKELDYIINNVDHGNKLLTLLHKGITEDNMDIDLDIDEVLDN